jgi:hypothetical protein
MLMRLVERDADAVKDGQFSSTAVDWRSVTSFSRCECPQAHELLKSLPWETTSRHRFAP